MSRYYAKEYKKTFFFSVLCLLYFFKIYLREKGWLRKKSIRGKHLFITGAGSGLGRLMSIRFAKLGANLTISDMNHEGVLET